MAAERRIVTIEGGGPDLRPCVLPARRSGRFIWFDHGAVPDLAQGSSGRFEIERDRAKGATWRVLRRVDG